MGVFWLPGDAGGCSAAAAAPLAGKIRHVKSCKQERILFLLGRAGEHPVPPKEVVQQVRSISSSLAGVQACRWFSRGVEHIPAPHPEVSSLGPVARGWWIWKPCFCQIQGHLCCVICGNGGFCRKVVLLLIFLRTQFLLSCEFISYARDWRRTTPKTYPVTWSDGFKFTGLVNRNGQKQTFSKVL